MLSESVIYLSGLTLLAYLVGSIPAALPVCRWLGKPDPRTAGSGNPGASNVFRVAGVGAGISTFVLDALKGVLMVMMARLLKLGVQAELIVLIAAVAGHLYPVYLKFKGGKGVSTYLGGLWVINYPLAIIACAVWLTVVVISRISSLASITAAVASAILSFWFLPNNAWLLVALALIIILNHQRNLRALLRGDERRLR